MENICFKVCVQCNTYNQSKYITDALYGFCIQETNFPFVCCIIDDASTDGEQEVIRQYIQENFKLESFNGYKHYETDYAEIIFAQHKLNKNCYFSVLFLKENHYSKNEKHKKIIYISEWRDKCKYEALCEGDDWWIDKKKLQKQNDILDSHPEYSLCHHDFKISKNGLIKSRNENIPNVQDLLSIAKNNTVHTLSMFYRNIGEPIIPTDFPFKYHVYQFFMNLRLAEFGNIVYIDEPMAVYRVNDGGVFSMKNNRSKFSMSIGNLENMIDWYKEGNPNPAVVEILKKRVVIIGKSFVKLSIKNLNILDSFFMIKWILRIFFFK